MFSSIRSIFMADEKLFLLLLIRVEAEKKINSIFSFKQMFADKSAKDGINPYFYFRFDSKNIEVYTISS